VFGIEVAVDALVGPSHLLLGAGVLLILTSPLRAQHVLSDGPGDASGGWTVTAMLSLTLSTTLVSFFLLYASPFPMPASTVAFTPTPEGTPGHVEAELPVVAGLGAYLITTAVLTVALLLMVRSDRPPSFVATLLVTPVAWLAVAVANFDGVAAAGALGATIGAMAADLGRMRLASVGANRPYSLAVVAGGVATMVWVGQLAGLAVADALRWPVSLWFGVVVLAGLAAAAMGLLAGPADRQSAQP